MNEAPPPKKEFFLSLDAVCWLLIVLPASLFMTGHTSHKSIIIYRLSFMFIGVLGLLFLWLKRKKTT